MTNKFYAILTDLGAAKLANATALGTTLDIAHMAVGDGGGSIPTPTASQTILIGEKRRAPLNSLSIDPNNTNQIIAEQIIPEDVGGWYIREIGLFDKDGILIAVANCPETYKPQLSEGSGRTQAVRMILIVNSTSEISLKIDPAVVLATRKYVDDLVLKHSESRAHPDATETQKGFVRLATSDDTFKGSNKTASVTPLRLQEKGYFHSQVNKQAVSQFTLQDFGRRVWIDNDSPATFTLPDIGNINSSGQTITIWNVKNSMVTISVGNPDDNISIPMSTVKSFKLMPTESVTMIVEQNSSWHATGDGILKYSLLFRSSVTENGWGYQPSGLIEQWGICNASGNTGVEAGYLNSFPIPFPNKCINIQLTHNGFSPGSAGIFSAMVLSNNAQFRAYSSMGNIYPAGTAYYRAIGY
ncbi:phage tail protein [Limnobaculum xujianqingii]|uniref:phage tail protein n=1 Tax=Limnobaculum xujianqingii TaxID=2738837 RepID=UPI001128B0F5|nr:phage tail protein [Limnobaculum xujianqingii]